MLPPVTLPRRLAAEALGSALLLAAVVGSGIMGERLAGGNAAVALLANSIATGATLAALILVLGPVSGAHFNPLVTVASAVGRRTSWRDVPPYVAAQFVGAFFGVATAHGMFGEPVFSASRHVRQGPGQLLGEGVATLGLLAVVAGTPSRRPTAAAVGIAAYITAAYWFSSSTAFANPAVTLARCATDTFAGIRPVDVPLFIVAQAVGAAAAIPLFRWLLPEELPG
ncbi:MAG TPA: MIP/aquaporin family protein [Planctomycetota bacterium]|nr:MIP/aquaporin family protein [Planctomycetota bacterium]